MKTFLRYKLWPVVAGISVAMITMILFEYINSLFFPIPESLNTSNLDDLHAFTASLPWTASILVFLGWILGSFKAGWVTTYVSKEKRYRLTFAVGSILTVFAVFNNVLIGHSALFNILSLPLFIIFTYLGHRYVRNKSA